MFKITEDVLDPRTLEALLENPANGALVTFQGVVRNHSQGRPVSYLEYDAYAPMAEKVMAQIAGEARERWPIGNVGIWHRIGRLEIGEASLIVAVGSPHRAEAFEATRYIVDRIKTICPIWKKEVSPDGEWWVEGDCLVDEQAHREGEAGANPIPAVTAVRSSDLAELTRPLTEAEAERMGRVLAASRELGKRILARRKGKPTSPSWILIRKAREERSKQLWTTSR